MGFLDSILGKGMEKSMDGTRFKGNPFRVNLRFSPVRLTAMKDNKVNLVVNIVNTAPERQLVSLDIHLPGDKLLGFDPTCINKVNEMKIGNLEPGESKDVVIPIHGSNQTKDGSYSVNVAVYAHYLDYNKVVSYVKKSTSLRVV